MLKQQDTKIEIPKKLCAHKHVFSYRVTASTEETITLPHAHC